MGVRRRLLAQARKNAGLTQEDLAYRLQVERSTVGRWESGATEPSPWCRPRLAKLLGVTRAELTDLLANRAPTEAPATIPAVVRGPVERSHLDMALADARRYLDSSVVDSFDQQLNSLMNSDGTDGPTKTLPAVLGVVSVVEQHARHVEPNIRRQLLRVGMRSAEFAGWLYRDAFRPDLALYWRDRATEWAMETEDWAMQGYILLKKSQSAWDERDGLRMLTLAQVAQTGPWNLAPRVQAEVAQQVARGLAMTGATRTVVQGQLDQAHDLLASAEVEKHVSGQAGGHYSRDLLTMQSAICYCEAGQPTRAAELYQACLDNQSFSYRDQGYFSSLQASALALAGEPDQATTVASQALKVAEKTNSRRTKQELIRVSNLLRPWANHTAVRELARDLAS